MRLLNRVEQAHFVICATNRRVTPDLWYNIVIETGGVGSQHTTNAAMPQLLMAARTLIYPEV